MDAAPLTRMRWRLRGAWLWPSYVVLTFADAAVIHDLPLSGDNSSWVSGLLLGAVLNLLAVVLFANLLGRGVRRLRSDMPKLVARNYAGALLTLAVTFALVAGGLVHQHVVASDTFALEDATAQAEAYIGAHAPPAFQHYLRHLNTDAVEGAPNIFRTCASDLADGRYYCVVVNRSQPFGRSVHYSGTEPNWLLFEGTS